jgi:hypothetical protein
MRPVQANTLRRPIPKIIREKQTGCVVQVVECLLCKHEALISNPSPTKKKKEKNGKS